MKKSLAYYLSLPYTLEVIPEPEAGGYTIRVKELPGCITQADHWEDIPAMAQDAMEGWIAVALEHGDSIPEPIPA